MVLKASPILTQKFWKSFPKWKKQIFLEVSKNKSESGYRKIALVFVILKKFFYYFIIRFKLFLRFCFDILIAHVWPTLISVLSLCNIVTGAAKQQNIKNK